MLCCLRVQGAERVHAADRMACLPVTNSFPVTATPQQWQSAYSDDGMLYYYNTITGETQWDNPFPEEHLLPAEYDVGFQYPAYASSYLEYDNGTESDHDFSYDHQPALDHAHGDDVDDDAYSLPLDDAYAKYDAWLAEQGGGGVDDDFSGAPDVMASQGSTGLDPTDYHVKWGFWHASNASLYGEALGAGDGVEAAIGAEASSGAYTSVDGVVRDAYNNYWFWDGTAFQAYDAATSMAIVLAGESGNDGSDRADVIAGVAEDVHHGADVTLLIEDGATAGDAGESLPSNGADAAQSPSSAALALVPLSPNSAASFTAQPVRSHGDWQCYVDESCGKEYYYNTVTQESTWLPPLPELRPAVASALLPALELLSYNPYHSLPHAIACQGKRLQHCCGTRRRRRSSREE